MKRLFILLSILLIPFITQAQTKIRGNVFIVTGTDTVWITQDGSNATFDATKPFIFTQNLQGLGTGAFVGIVTAAVPDTSDASGKLVSSQWVRDYLSGFSPGGGITPAPGDANKFLTTNGTTTRFTDSLLTTLKIPQNIKLRFGGFAYSEMYYNSTSGAFEISGNSNIELLEQVTVGGNLLFSGGADRLFYVNGSNGENLLIMAAGSFYGGGGDLFLSPGSGLAGAHGDVWLASRDGVTFYGNARAETLAPKDSSDNVATTEYVDKAVATGGGGGGSSLPSQTGHSGKFLTTNGTDASWASSIVLNWKWNDDVQIIYGTDSDYFTKYNSSTNRWELSNVTRALLYHTGSYWGAYGNLLLDNGGARAIGISSMTSGTGKALTIAGGSSSSGNGGAMYVTGGSGDISSGSGGNVYIYGGSGAVGNSPQVWLGYSDAGSTDIGSVYVKTQSGSDSSRLVASTEYVDQAIYGITAGGVIPTQTGKENMFLTTNGTAASWSDTVRMDWALTDSTKFLLGTGADGQMYSDGSNVIIAAQTNTYLKSISGEVFIIGTTNGAVSLYYDNSQKLNTTTGGIDVVGDIDLAASANRTIYVASESGSTGGRSLTVRSGSAGVSGATGGNLNLTTGDGVTTSGNIFLYTGAGSSAYGGIYFGSSNGSTFNADVYSKSQATSDSTNKIATTKYVKQLFASGSSGLPSQTGNAGKILMTNGSTASWGDTIGVNMEFQDNVYMKFGDDSDFLLGYYSAAPDLRLTDGSSNYLQTWTPSQVTIYASNVEKASFIPAGLRMNADIQFTSGSGRTIDIADVTGASASADQLSLIAGDATNVSSVGGNMFIRAGNALVSGSVGGNTYILPGDGVTDGVLWLGTADGTTFVGTSRSQTAAQGTNSTVIATTGYVDRMVPNVSGNSGKYLTNNGSSTSWATVSASAGGSTGQLQYNSAGSLAGTGVIAYSASFPNLTFSGASAKGIEIQQNDGSSGIDIYSDTREVINFDTNLEIQANGSADDFITFYNSGDSINLNANTRVTKDKYIAFGSITGNAAMLSYESGGSYAGYFTIGDEAGTNRGFGYHPINGNIVLLYQGATKLSTVSGGIQVTGSVNASTGYQYNGSAGSGGTGTTYTVNSTATDGKLRTITVAGGIITGVVVNDSPGPVPVPAMLADSKWALELALIVICGFLFALYRKQKRDKEELTARISVLESKLLE